MKKVALVVSLFVALAQGAQAQTEGLRRHHIGIGSGFLYSRNRDALASPFVYKGWGLPAQFMYCFRGVRHRHDVTLSVSGARLSSPIASGENHVLNDHRASLVYGYRRFVRSLFGQRGGLFLGGGWDSHLSSRALTYRRGFDEPYGELVSSLDLSALIEFKINGEAEVSYQFSLPAASLVLRSPYAGKGPVSPEVATLLRYFRFKNQMVYERHVSPRFDIRFRYEGVYYTFPEPRRTKTGMDQVSFEVFYKI